MIDLSPFNEFVQQTPFKMETAASVLLSVRKGDFLASINLKDAYFFFFFFFYEWEHRTGKMCPFSSLHPLKKGKEV